VAENEIAVTRKNASALGCAKMKRAAVLRVDRQPLLRLAHMQQS